MKNVAISVLNKLPASIRDTAFIRLFGFMKIPMLYFIKPSVVEMSDKNCVVKIPLNRKTKNHLNSMYFGVMCAAADCAGGLLAMKKITESGVDISLAFKDFNAEFLKRAEGDTYFSNVQGEEVKSFVEKVIESGERENMPVFVTATVPSKFGDEPVAQFTLTLSLKKRG